MPRTNSLFPCFQTPLDLAKSYWKKVVQPDDFVIDATLGNGKDTLFLSQLGRKVLALDIQQQAIDKAKAYLEENQQLENVTLLKASHATFPKWIEKESVSLIVYNLGYLPGGDKSLTTTTETTLKSLLEALELIAPGGAISVTCYPGHMEGKKEEEAILAFASKLSPKEWSVCHHTFLNRRLSPSLLLIQRSTK